MTDIATIDGWHVFQLCHLSTMKERAELRHVGVLVYIELLIDGVGVDYPDKELPCEQLVLLNQILKKVLHIMWQQCQATESIVRSGGRAERAYHCDGWNIEWRELR